MNSQNNQISSIEIKEWLKRHIPYRIQCLKGLQIRNSSQDRDLLQKTFPGIHEATLSNCRWAAELFGLKLNKNKSNKLKVELRDIGLDSSMKPIRREPDDIFVTDLGGELLHTSNIKDDLKNKIGIVYNGAHKKCLHPVRDIGLEVNNQMIEEVASFFIKAFDENLYAVIGSKMPQDWDPPSESES